MNAKAQGFKIQDSNREDWLYFIYNIDLTSYKLGPGFQATYSLGMKLHNLSNKIKKKHKLAHKNLFLDEFVEARKLIQKMIYSSVDVTFPRLTAKSVYHNPSFPTM